MFKFSNQRFLATLNLIRDLLNHILIAQKSLIQRIAWVERSKIYRSITTFAMIPLIFIMYLKTSVYPMPNSFLPSAWLAHISSFFTSQRWSSFCSGTADGEEEKSAAPIEEDRTEDQVRKKMVVCRDCKKGGDWPRPLLIYWIESLSSSRGKIIQNHKLDPFYLEAYPIYSIMIGNPEIPYHFLRSISPPCLCYRFSFRSSLLTFSISHCFFFFLCHLPFVATQFFAPLWLYTDLGMNPCRRLSGTRAERRRRK